MTISEFMIEQMGVDQKRFLKLLGDVPAEDFAKATVGHSPAWHALHIGEWTRILVSPGLQSTNPNERFAHLGWEESDFAKAVHGPTALGEHSSKESILAWLAGEFERALGEIKTHENRFEETIAVPTGQRIVKNLLSAQLRHVPYHVGQLGLVIKHAKTI